MYHYNNSMLEGIISKVDHELSTPLEIPVTIISTINPAEKYPIRLSIARDLLNGKELKTGLTIRVVGHLISKQVSANDDDRRLILRVTEVFFK